MSSALMGDNLGCLLARVYLPSQLGYGIPEVSNNEQCAHGHRVGLRLAGVSVLGFSFFIIFICFSCHQLFALLFVIHSDEQALKLVTPADLAAGAVKAKRHNWHEPSRQTANLSTIGEYAAHPLLA